MIGGAIIIITAVVIGFRFLSLFRRRWLLELPIFLAGSTLAMIGAFAVSLWFEDVRLINLAGEKFGLRKSITGMPSVRDGDGLMFGDVEIRLLDIDAPERAQCCIMPDGSRAPIGQRSLESLQRRIQGKYVTCTWLKTEGRGRPLGSCMVDDIDLNAWMVAHGWAYVYRSKSGTRRRYLSQERIAQDRSVGVHACRSIVRPYDYRRLKGAAKKAQQC